MRTAILDEIKYAVKNWWLSLILGILFVGVAIMIMFTPEPSYAALAIVLSVCVFTCGIFEIAFAVSNKDNLSGWGWYLAGGVIDLLIGLLLIFMPGLTMLMIPYLLAFWIMFRGFSAIGISIDMSSMGLSNWGWYLVFGILAVLCAIAIIFMPAVGALASIYIVAFSFLFIGTFRIMLSFDLKNLKDHSEKLKERLTKIDQMMIEK